MKDLDALIKKETPNIVQHQLTDRNGKVDYSGDDELGTSDHWGYTYPRFLEGPDRESFYLESLNNMQRGVVSLFGPERIIYEAREETPRPLKRPFIRRMIESFSRSNIDIRRGIEILTPKKTGPMEKRLVIFGYGSHKKVSFSFHPGRHHRGCKVTWENGKPLDLAAFDDDLPVTILFSGFDRGDEIYRDLNEKLRRKVFGPMYRDFPEVDATPPSSQYELRYSGIPNERPRVSISSSIRDEPEVKDFLAKYPWTEYLE